MSVHLSAQCCSDATTDGGFTLTEILIALAIIAILVVLPMLAYTSFIKKARDTQRKNDINKIQAALEQYKASNGRYPEKDNWLHKLVKEQFLPDNVVDPYDQKLAGDEGLYYAYDYEVSDNGQDYQLTSLLEGSDGPTTGSANERTVYVANPIGTKVVRITPAPLTGGGGTLVNGLVTGTIATTPDGATSGSLSLIGTITGGLFNGTYSGSNGNGTVTGTVNGATDGSVQGSCNYTGTASAGSLNATIPRCVLPNGGRLPSVTPRPTNTLFPTVAARPTRTPTPSRTPTATRTPTPAPLIATNLSSGWTFTCAVTNAGTGMCWGNNANGQLGEGTTTNRLQPYPVSALALGTSTISASLGNACALTSLGAVRCWGWNEYGQIGDGTTTQRLTPVPVTNLSSGVSSVSIGAYFACARTTSGGVKCWGRNHTGQLGDSTSTDRSTPVDVVGLTSGVMAITTGGGHGCALTTSGGAKCWGANWPSGQLGDGTNVAKTSPVNVVGLTSGVAAITAGDAHTCALVNMQYSAQGDLLGGGVKCWGNNTNGQVGNGSPGSTVLTPVDVSGLTSGIIDIVAGHSHTCALTAGGGVKCWGQNTYGQLGDGTTTERRTPIDTIGLSTGVKQVSAGIGHTCARTSTNRVKCWGENASGEVGDGTTADRITPVDVVPFQ